jgi:hypothetical protein
MGLKRGKPTEYGANELVGDFGVRYIEERDPIEHR